MPLKLFELVGTDEERPFSPFCWRTRMALAHKGLSAESIPWCFTEKEAIAPHKFRKSAGADRRRNLGRRFLDDRELSGRQLSGPAVAVRRRGRPRLGPDVELVGRRHRDRRHVPADRPGYSGTPEAGRRGV